MAEKKPKPQDAGKEKGGMTMAQNAIGFVVAGVIAGGVGAGVGMMNKPVPPGPAAKEGAKPVERKEEAAPLVQMGSLEVPPAVTNLASPKEVWVRIEGAILFEGKTLPRGDALAAEISADILAFLRTQTLEQIQGVAGLEHLRADINERVQTRSQGAVKKFIIKALVVQ
ncbi:flagellar FliL protein [Rhodoblastus acidophilus]|uniref:flagellar basal body-associated FliL family protein n=1 Tax=Rhodoblastus acidophilus TaxID=1074 RepID=UPI00222441AD|nr:flagellar basal body-associated FliL family protein [Rhodoblastus acidophilus]MCW2284614.1 flagellar FliL protein [Rhodoblastus acidophilus]MCW2333567.1 flagellar FliL protein [Rhodoblastus acidophilus]